VSSAYITMNDTTSRYCDPVFYLTLIGQGRENAKQFLKENPDIANKIEAAVRQNAGLIAEAIMAGEAGDKDSDDEEAAEA